ncbi:MAG: hypothetical protein EXR67_06745 [Dehalococcoidia bacterium]|nr:hypothetical protein [Dehalococcoidia bacterium]
MDVRKGIVIGSVFFVAVVLLMLYFSLHEARNSAMSSDTGTSMGGNMDNYGQRLYSSDMNMAPASGMPTMDDAEHPAWLQRVLKFLRLD